MELKDLSIAVVTIMLIGLILGIGIYVLVTFRANIATEYTGSDLTAPANNTAAGKTFTLSDASKDNYNLESVTSILNASDGHAWTNYTFTAAGVITYGYDIYSLNTTVNISSIYTYDASGSPEEAVQNTLEGADDFSDWIAVIVVVIAAAVILGIVLKSFGREAQP